MILELGVAVSPVPGSVYIRNFVTSVTWNSDIYLHIHIFTTNNMSRFSEKASDSVIALATNDASLSREKKEYRQVNGQDNDQSYQASRELNASTSLNTSTNIYNPNEAGTLTLPGRSLPPLLLGSCQTSACSCLRGHFTSHKSKCISCPHNMNNHARSLPEGPWSQTPDNLCSRGRLVKDVIQRLPDERVIVIRAPPLTGKSTLLNLIGLEIIRNHDEYEPVKILWPGRSDQQIRDKPYHQLLKEELEKFQIYNSEARLTQNSTHLESWGLFRGVSKFVTQLIGLAKGTNNARRKRQAVYLIDDAIETYPG